jgi:hypothetical protein
MKYSSQSGLSYELAIVKNGDSYNIRNGIEFREKIGFRSDISEKNRSFDFE